VGSEGLWGCENDMALLERVTAIPDVDYMTIHIWPYNWSWAHADRLVEDLPDACAKTDEYIAAHLELAKRYGQPVVVEEFGFPRDGFSPERTATTEGRDTYYRHLFSKVGKEIDGANFWGWSGFARPRHTQWERGDDYAGDPAQEAQGLNGVYADDTTVEIIKQSIININNQPNNQ
jgi:mannan endo-1,4-beta-mannosidase